MHGKNKYIKGAHILERKFWEIVRYFSADLNAVQISELSGLNRNTINRYLILFRERIAQYCEAASPLQREIEVDESCFGARRVRGKRGRGAYGKTIVFGLLKGQGKVYTEIVPNVKAACYRPLFEVTLILKV